VAVYCTSADVVSRLSQAGVDSRTDDDPAAPAFLNDCTDRASATVDEHCLVHYSAANLGASRWVNKVCTDLAAVEVCRRRGNPVPAALEKEAERVLARLELVRKGLLEIPEVGKKKSEAPVLSNVRVRLDPFPRVVVERAVSTGTPEGYNRNDDALGWVYDFQI
jgi:hypothetical protein